jgi:hypothetical protein
MVSPSVIETNRPDMVFPKVQAQAAEPNTKAKKTAIGSLIRGNEIIESGNEGFRIIWNE